MQDTINETFSGLVKAVGAKLKPLGYTPQSRLFRILVHNNCGIIEFQRSVKSSAESLLFTVNLGVVCGKLLDSGPSGLMKARTMDAHLRERIGMLLPDRPDKWWEITEETNRDSLIHEISEMIVKKALPFIERYLDTNSLIALWESGQSPGLTEVQRVRLLAKLKMS
jgi:hypothetical protein